MFINLINKIFLAFATISTAGAGVGNGTGFTEFCHIPLGKNSNIVDSLNSVSSFSLQQNNFLPIIDLSTIFITLMILIFFILSLKSKSATNPIKNWILSLFIFFQILCSQQKVSKSLYVWITLIFLVVLIKSFNILVVCKPSYIVGFISSLYLCSAVFIIIGISRFETSIDVTRSLIINFIPFGITSAFVSILLFSAEVLYQGLYGIVLFLLPMKYVATSRLKQSVLMFLVVNVMILGLFAINITVSPEFVYAFSDEQLRELRLYWFGEEKTPDQIHMAYILSNSLIYFVI